MRWPDWQVPRFAGHFFVFWHWKKLQEFQRVRNFLKSRNLHVDNALVMQIA
jgi:hypothetical protein